ncbi:hypothetical protein Bandiella_00820 [Candidatus Bandiella woodruffii]|uniref:Uncharacterized protein n=1 Tax=Candidatus Bandiella euplotis TaxID=1664265 RepID=A0ABZ0UKP3_9RICK|nr:hypothetical protein Bandiella_00820 [Candidatus Bandiella woodruffii]
MEDSDCTVELIEKEFNPRVAQIVGRLTNKRQVKNGKTIEKLSLQEVVDKLHEAADHGSVARWNKERYSGVDYRIKEEKNVISASNNNGMFGSIGW